METLSVLKENWFTRKPNHDVANLTTGTGLFLYFASFLFFAGSYGSTDWMPATYGAVFTRHEYWRLWTTLFAHGDFGHLLNNSILFLPFAYLLSGYFGWVVFPFLGVLLGGLINWIVLATMPPDVALIGISGVVYWMGAAYITLHFLIDRRQTLRRRFAGALFITMVLFVPDTYQPQVSYLSHFVGYLLGLISAVGYYYWNRHRFHAAEVWEHVIDDSVFWDPEVISQNETEEDDPALSKLSTPV
jgi:rhomboid protease GluP